MSRVKIEDLSVERTLEGSETDNIIGAGHHGHGHHHHHNHGGGWGGGGWGGGGWGGGYRPPRYHDTSHLHYQPGGFVPHGNHYHYVPGQYYIHRQGHWHY